MSGFDSHGVGKGSIRFEKCRVYPLPGQRLAAEKVHRGGLPLVLFVLDFSSEHPELLLHVPPHVQKLLPLHMGERGRGERGTDQECG
jgi:hypothetical protein